MNQKKDIRHIYTKEEIEIILSRFKNNKVFALTWDDIDFDNRISNINKTVYAKDKDESGRWYLGTTKTIGSQREVYICDSLYAALMDYKNIQNNLKKHYGKKYKTYILKEVKNKYGKLIEYKIIESNFKCNKVEMVFTRKDGTYSGTDIIRYPFKIIHYKLGINCRFYDLRGSFATKLLRNGNEIKDISKLLDHSRIETTENYYITSTTNDLIKISKSIEKDIDINLIDKF